MNTDSKLIKQMNFQKIHTLFYRHAVLSKPQIAALLNLSMPTVTANIAALEQAGLIKRADTVESKGGRPAVGYTLVPDAQVAFGVEIKFDQVRCAVVNLQGKASAVSEYPLPCTGNSSYLADFCTIVKDYIAASGFSAKQILGIGISVQAVVDNQGSSMIYSHILPLKKLQASDFAREFGYKVLLCHDVEAAASSELWHDATLQDAIYVSISEHLGGALIHQHALEHGKQGYAGALEHLPAGQEGRQCYCGRTDCLETYCSLSALLSRHEKLRDFFTLLRESAHEHECHQRWLNYLNHLAQGLYPTYQILERDIILGGDLAPYLVPQDLLMLEEAVKRYSPFLIKEPFIHVAKVQINPALIGAALLFIRKQREESATLN